MLTEGNLSFPSARVQPDFGTGIRACFWCCIWTHFVDDTAVGMSWLCWASFTILLLFLPGLLKFFLLGSLNFLHIIHTLTSSAVLVSSRPLLSLWEHMGLSYLFYAPVQVWVSRLLETLIMCEWRAGLEQVCLMGSIAISAAIHSLVCHAVRVAFTAVGVEGVQYKRIPLSFLHWKESLNGRRRRL